MSLIIHAQTLTIKGVVVDKKTNLPIDGASIYFDNTTIGTISKPDGIFSIEKDASVKSPMVISFLGYQKVVISNTEPDKRYKILMEETSFSLDEVVLTDDNWSRTLKLKEFRKHFLGTTKNGKSCKILNEDELILKYNKKTKTLTATAYQPLQIKNKNLNYLISYDLQEFYVEYNYVTETTRDYRSTFFSGTGFFKPLDVRKEKTINKKREKAYKGSALHFMRALSNQNLKEEKFLIGSRGFTVNPEKYITVDKIDSLNVFRVSLSRPIDLYYKRNNTTKVIPKFKSFYIDGNGNHYPPNAVTFADVVGERRFGDALPLDYDAGN